ncbi:MAG: hypothetical protein PHE83_06090 [Opitutaceae bacterium]|nr:hypothetical protein [Opitutaceae bacterium]
MKSGSSFFCNHLPYHLNNGRRPDHVAAGVRRLALGVAPPTSRIFQGGRDALLARAAAAEPVSDLSAIACATAEDLAKEARRVSPPLTV